MGWFIVGFTTVIRIVPMDSLICLTFFNVFHLEGTNVPTQFCCWDIGAPDGTHLSLNHYMIEVCFIPNLGTSMLIFPQTCFVLFLLSLWHQPVFKARNLRYHELQ